MRINLLYSLCIACGVSFVAFASAQITTDFSSMAVGPVTGANLNSVTSGGVWYLNTARGATFEIQEDGSSDKAIMGDDTVQNDGTITLMAVTAMAGNQVDLTTHDATFSFTVGTRRTGTNKGLRYQFLNQAGTAVIATLDWLHNGNQLILNAGAVDEDSKAIGSAGFSSSYIDSWDSLSPKVRDVSVVFSGTSVTANFGDTRLISSSLNSAIDVGRIRIQTIGSAASAKGAFLDEITLSATPSQSVIPGPVLEWNAEGPGNTVDLYQEGNWIDPVTGHTPPLTTVDPDVTLNRSLVIRNGTPGGAVGAQGDLLLGTGDLTVGGATLRMNQAAGSSINMGTGSKNLSIVDGKVFTHAISSGVVSMDGYSDLTLYGSNPLSGGTTVDLLSPNCFVYFLNTIPTSVISSELSHLTVNGVAAVSNSNVLVTQYYNGTIVRPKLANNGVMKGFDGADLTGSKWNFTTGFKGRVGAGLIAYNDGIYNMDGWGTDIGSTADQCRFTCKDMAGDVEIIAKIAWVQNTETLAKGGVMMRADLAAGAANAFVFQRPDKQITFQWRTTTGGNTSSIGPLGGTGSVKWVRLVRSGNNFSGYYSTGSATGPWTQVGSTTAISMPSTIKAGIAATSHLGLERGRTNFHEVSTVPASSLSAYGIFDESVDIEAAWWLENSLSSFLLKKGYMVTLSSEGGGQGFSQVYVASEEDITVNLPPQLDNNVRFMRILPWRWIAKRGWGGSRNDHQALIQSYWSYAWEPTGSSTNNSEFVPMIKGRGQDKEFRWLEVRARGGQTHFLCFNEPESSNQGDLSVDEAIALWPKAQQLGLRLVSPGRTDGNNGNNWLSSFMAQVDAKGYRVDVVNVHNYNKKTAASLKDFLDAEYAKYGKPIWLTEFQRENNDNPSTADHEAYLAEVIPMLESLDYLERYAYFDFNTGGVTSSTASLFNNGPVLNAKGEIYRNVESQSSYTNRDQLQWATASIDLVSGGIIQSSEGGMITASTSIDFSKVSRVEFFVNGVSVGTDSSPPYQLSVDRLGSGLQSIHTVVTTNFGERVISSPTQAFVTDLRMSPTSPSHTGNLRWSAVPGETYYLESSEDLNVWDVESERIATGFEETLMAPDWGGGTQRFYRVRW